MSKPKTRLVIPVVSFSGAFGYAKKGKPTEVPEAIAVEQIRKGHAVDAPGNPPAGDPELTPAQKRAATIAKQKAEAEAKEKAEAEAKAKEEADAKAKASAEAATGADVNGKDEGNV